MLELTELIVTRGIPGSGKSFWAKNWVAEDVRHRARVERDQLRAMMHDSVYIGHHTENQITTAQKAMVKSLLKAGVSVIVSDTNLDLNTFKGWRVMAVDLGVTFRMQDFRDVPLEVCIERNAKRTGKEFIPEDVIRSKWERYIKP